MTNVPAMDDRVLGFVQWLRAAGLEVPVSSTLSFIEALTLLDDDLTSVHRAARATLAHSPAEIELLDLVFRQWILGEGFTAVPVESASRAELEMADDDADDDCDGPESTDGPPRDDRTTIRFSRTETLAERDFATLDDDERAEVDRLLASLRFAASTRRSRRRRPAGPNGDRIDLRRTIRGAMRTDGETFVLHTRTRTTRPRRLVLLVDISGSMSSYARALLRFANTAVIARDDVEVFALGTRLTRLTRELDTHDPDRALERASDAVEDWSGGTRLGEVLRRFNDEWGARGMARGAVVVVLSDGWDRGEPAEVAEQMARLHRIAHRIVWVNPLKASPGYEPIARGMAAALPFIDDFVEGHSFASLDRLADIVSRAGDRVVGPTTRPMMDRHDRGVEVTTR